MRRAALPVLVVVTLVTLLACDQQKLRQKAIQLLQRIVPHDVDERDRGWLALLTHGQTDSARARLLPSAGEKEAVPLDSVAALLNGQIFDSMQVVNVDIKKKMGARRVTLEYDIYARSGAIVARVTTVDTAGTWFVERFSASRVDGDDR